MCENCGSSVRTLYSTFLWIPVSKLGRFRIIPTGGRSYIGRQVVARSIDTVVPEPVSALVNHPERDGDPAYKLAEAHWDDSEPVAFGAVMTRHRDVLHCGAGGRGAKWGAQSCFVGGSERQCAG
ncbi:hypothetical protein [Kribbella sp. NPDC049227]|uniref:hypothetical protein n=1 Tax=Kribbella sp. NPDC049227 TaxID=3364113 RepID=UPI003712C453